jgi:poly(3-hydroxybutyrate) depolymerase
MPTISNETFVPDELSEARPLLVPFHGGGRDGASQIELWKPVAEREQIIILAPTSGNGWWAAQTDFENVAAQINATTGQLPVDMKRVYFFGHSLGAVRALDWGYANRCFVAAIALHSPSMASGIFQLKAEPGTRRLPMGFGWEKKTSILVGIVEAACSSPTKNTQISLLI